MEKTIASLAGLIFLLFIISQFIAFFKYSNMATIAAVKVGDWLEQSDSARCHCSSALCSSSRSST